MSNLIITCGSVTSAIRIKKKLNQISNFSAAVIHTPSEINSSGCSYSVKTSSNNYNNVISLKNANKISYSKLYIQENVAKEIVYRDISWQCRNNIKKTL